MIKIFNIEKFATHDGPGIRTTLFFKGCPLHCPWCANPESWSLKPTMMYDQRKCVKCKNCVLSCLNNAITFYDKFEIDTSKCKQCQKCVQSCFHQAIKFVGEDMSINDIVEEVLKDKDYYDNSHGGITLSGGEPFVQFDEMFKLVQELKKHNLHIAVETTGHYELKYLKQVLPYIDLFLFDIKHINKERLKKIVGGDLNLILNNLQYLSKKCPEKVIVRVPVIPQFNYSKETLYDIIDYVKKLGIKEINLLPYHSLGENKWEQINKDYLLKDLKMMDKSVLEEYVQYGKSQNINVKIGG